MINTKPAMNRVTPDPRQYAGTDAISEESNANRVRTVLRRGGAGTAADVRTAERGLVQRNLISSNGESRWQLYLARATEFYSDGEGNSVAGTRRSPADALRAAMRLAQQVSFVLAVRRTTGDSTRKAMRFATLPTRADAVCPGSERFADGFIFEFLRNGTFGECFHYQLPGSK